MFVLVSILVRYFRPRLGHKNTLFDGLLPDYTSFVKNGYIAANNSAVITIIAKYTSVVDESLSSVNLSLT